MCQLGFVLGLLAAVVVIVCGTGEYEIRLVNFMNHDGVDAAGGCCDTAVFFCSSPCDHRISICVDNRQGSNNPQTCAFGSVTIPAIDNQDILVFGDRIEGRNNSFIFPFDSKPDGVKVKIDVWDEDSTSGDDHVVTLITNIPADLSGFRTFTTAASQMNLRMTFRIRVSCHENYYGNCAIYCYVPANRAQHEVCNPVTGEKTCLEGWQGDGCNTRVCPTGFSGDDCLTPVACSPNPCQNGGLCEPDGLNFVCACTAGFTGLTCEIAASGNSTSDSFAVKRFLNSLE